MLKLNAIVSKDTRLRALSEQLQHQSQLQQLWQSAAPKEIALNSVANDLKNGVLHITTTQAIVASKIKMMHASLLKALENSRNTYQHFNQHKVTAIKVKVQVKSTPRPLPSRLIPISASSAQHIRTFADKLAGTPLGDALKKLSANKT